MLAWLSLLLAECRGPITDSRASLLATRKTVRRRLADGFRPEFEARNVPPNFATGNLCLGFESRRCRSNEVTACTTSGPSLQGAKMAIHARWTTLLTTWKKLRPARRRRQPIGFRAEVFEPRRLLSAFVVNHLADSHDANPGDGIAADANGFTTLRAALEEANVLPGADTITLPPGVIALSAANGPLVVSDDLTIIGSGTTVIDGTALEEIFSVNGPVDWQLREATVRSSLDVIPNRPAAWLTTNERQADLIVAFSASPSAPLTVDAKSPNGLSSLIGLTTPESVFDESPVMPVAQTAIQPAKFDDSVVPTPDQAIDQIINALFRKDPDGTRPANAEADRNAPSSDQAPPMSSSGESLPEDSPTFDSGERSLAPTDDDVRTVLRQWADEAGWSDFDFLTRRASVVAARPNPGTRIAAAVGLLSGLLSRLFFGDLRKTWRHSWSLTRQRTRLAKWRRRTR